MDIAQSVFCGSKLTACTFWMQGYEIGFVFSSSPFYSEMESEPPGDPVMQLIAISCSPNISYGNLLLSISHSNLISNCNVEKNILYSIRPKPKQNMLSGYVFCKELRFWHFNGQTFQNTLTVGRSKLGIHTVVVIQFRAFKEYEYTVF